MLTARIFSEYEKGWLSGLIDGEGSISVVWHNRKKGRLRKNGSRAPLREIPPCPSIRMTITNTYLPLLEKAQEVMGVGTIHRKKSKRILASRRRPGWTYQNSNQITVKQVLNQLELVAKGKHRELALELLELKTHYRKNGVGTDPEIRTKAVSVAREINELNLTQGSSHMPRKEEHYVIP